MNCKNCGKELNGNARFCAACGTKVELEQPVATEPIAEPVFVPSVEPVAVSVEPVPVADFGYVPEGVVEPIPAKKKVKPLKIIMPIVAVVLVAAIAVGAFFIFGKEEYYMSKVAMYQYDEDGEVSSKLVYVYDEFMLPIEMKNYQYDELVQSMGFVADENGRIVEVKFDDGEEKYSIEVEYEKEDGKYIGSGEAEEGDGEIEIVYDSDNSYTIEMKEDGEIVNIYHCYVNDDGYNVLEEESLYYKRIYVRNGPNPIESKSYSREDKDDDFELTSSVKYTYNDDGFLVEHVSKYEDTEQKTVCERNKNNVPVSITEYEDGEKISYTEIVEEDDGKIVLERFDEDDETISFIEYGFDGKRLLYEKVFDEDEELLSEITYNENGLQEKTVAYSDGEVYSKYIVEYTKK